MAAFSLIEMMIAIAIIGLLLGISIPRYSKIRAEAKIREAESDVEMLSSAIKQLAWDTGRWPRGIRREIRGDAECWDLASVAAGLMAKGKGFSNWQGPYLVEVPKDPWGSNYFFDPDYRIDGVMRPVVGSFGPNKIGRNKYDADNVYVVLD